MKKNFLLVFAAAAILAGGVSCSKEGDVFSETIGQTGALKVSITWVQQETKAATSSGVVPITTWANNIDDMWLVLSSGGIIKDVRSITPETANNNSQITRLFNDLEIGTYDIYVVANAGKTTTPFGNGAVTPSTTIGNSLKGTTLSAFMLNLQTVAAASTVGTDPTSTVTYSEPAEIFIAKATGVTISQDATTTVASPLALTRAVSLLRVRINQVYDSTTYPGSIDNSGVNFQTSGSVATRLRYHGTGIGVADAANASAAPYGIQGITTTAASLNNALYSGKIYKTAADFDSTKYATGADMGLSTSDFTLWNEYLMLPGGSASDGNLKFNIALTGLAPAGYVAIDGTTGAQTTLTSAQIVTWTGQVTAAVKPNNILELNLHLLKAGIVGPDIPTPTQYGNLDISLNLLDWDTNVTYVNIEM